MCRKQHILDFSLKGCHPNCLTLFYLYVAGHPKIRAFVTHGGLLSLFETVYHGVPVVAMPVFCDHDSNVEKAVQDGYAIRLELQELTATKLLKSVTLVMNDPK